MKFYDVSQKSSGVNWMDCEADHPPPSGAEVKNL